MDYLLSRENYQASSNRELWSIWITGVKLNSYHYHIYVMVVGLVASLKSLVAFHLSRVADDFKIVDAHYSIFNV